MVALEDKVPNVRVRRDNVFIVIEQIYVIACIRFD